MKPRFFANCLILALTSSVMSCGGGEGEEPTPTPPTPPIASITITGEAASGLNFSSEGGSKSITFTATDDWSVSVASTGSDPWCSVNPSSGTSSQTSVSVTVGPNEHYDDRSVSVNFTCGSQRKTVVVTQKQKDALLVTSAKVEMDNKGGTFTSEVKANIDYTVKIPEQFAGWISPVTSRGLKTSTATFNVAANDNFESREGYVTFSGAGIEERVYVYQSGGAKLLLSPTETYIDARGGTVKAELQSNCDFIVEMPQLQWIHKDVSRAMSSHTIYFTVDENVSTDDREAKIRFVSPDKSVSDTLTVVQRAKGTVVVTNKNIDVPVNGGVYQVEYASNTQVTYNISEDAGSWISKTNAPASRSMTTADLWFKVKANSTDSPRTGTVVFHAVDSPDISDTVIFRQEAPIFEVVSITPADTKFKDAASHDIAIDLRTNIDYYFDKPKFVTLVSDPADKEHLKLHVNFNDNAKLSRSGYITFMAGIRVLASIVMEQAEPEVTMTADSYDVGYKGGVLPLDQDIKTNINISVEVPASAADWVKVTDASESSLVNAVEIAQNATEQERTCTLTFSAGAYWSKSVVVRQSPVPRQAADVSIPTGGNLADIITQDEAMEIVSLKMDGEVTANDVAFIQRMATEGKLTHLDLENTTIRKSNESYTDPYYNMPGIFTCTIPRDNMIGEHMFAKTKLATIKLPANLIEIGREAFIYSAITEIVLPDQVKVIGKSAFYGCGNLKKATLPGSLEEIPSECFMMARNLEYVTIGEGTRVIGESAFRYIPQSSGSLPTEVNTKLREVNIPSTVTTIKDYAFMYSGIETVTIPESVVNYGAELFYNCKRLKKVVMKGVPADGVLPDETFSGCDALAELELPEGLKVIGRNALYNIATPTLTLPSSLKELRDGALWGCLAQSLVIPEGVETLGELSLGQMWKMTELRLPSTLRSIGNKLLSSSLLPLRAIHCGMEVPPVPAGALVKDNFDFGGCTLYVPRGAADAYKNAQYWSSFTNIQEE